MSHDLPDLTECDVEPIRMPGSIQPHGLMLVVDRTACKILQVAGDFEGRFGIDRVLGRQIGAVLGDTLGRSIVATAHTGASDGYMGQLTTPAGDLLDVTAHRSGDLTLVELEPSSARLAPAAEVMGALELAVAAFSRADTVESLCARAVEEFRKLTGFDRVMVYRFLDDDAGRVLAEDKVAALPSFLNHHFPGSDVPRQARELYVRNLVRVIVDVDYTPQPLRPPTSDAVDMSDAALRSVSPIHLQYLRNMGVAASASVSILDDGVLWGLVACHHRTPRLLPYDVRAACRVLAASLSRQIRFFREASLYRERIKLRELEDDLLVLMDGAGDIELGLSDHLPLLRAMIEADGFAIVSRRAIHTCGACPNEAALKALAAWVLERPMGAAVATKSLRTIAPEQVDPLASGVLAVVIQGDDPLTLLWLRAEHLQVLNWAGNPHDTKVSAGGVLNPRVSFEAWSDTVRGVARDWSIAAIETVTRLRVELQDMRRQRRMRELNGELSESLAQKEMLLLEMNHRMQNSLQLVSSFLGLQARASHDPGFEAAIAEARRRLGAVSLVHRRLYRTDQIHRIDMARYIEELWGELISTMGDEWAKLAQVRLDPVTFATDRAVTTGLVITELIINANKYAYGGAPGPLEITLENLADKVRIVVADRGVGVGGDPSTGATGFGARMMAALVQQLAGELTHEPNHPGTRVVLTIPVKEP